MKIIHQIAIILLLFSQFGYAQDVSILAKRKTDSIAYYQARIKDLQIDLEDLKLLQLRKDLKAYGLPKLEAGEEVVEHLAMSLVYSEKHEQAKWVAHIITPDVIGGVEGRSNDFRPDPLIKTGSTVEEDYFLKFQQPDKSYKYEGFGYDRGHLAPSADFRWSTRALSESFFYSNMSPQVVDFNRDSWAKLEDMMRAYITRNPTTQFYMVTGPLLNDNLPKIPKAKNKVSIPEKYFKIAVDLKNKRAVAFVMPNKKAEYPHESYAVSIDEVEKLTGIDFFASLEDGLENELEAQKDAKPFLSQAEQSDVNPENPTTLPRNTFNTVQAKLYMGKGEKITVVGTVVSVKLSGKGNVFLNLDKKFPNQIFSVTIFAKSISNFSYKPEEFLEGKKISVKGIVTNFNGTPSMSIENENAIEVLEEE
jgi:endonuclease G, mitochondrial